MLAFAGTGWDGSFHGAVDNVMLSAGGQSLAANFEVSAPPPPPPAPAPVPTLGEWSLLLTGLLLAALGSRQAAVDAARATAADDNPGRYACHTPMPAERRSMPTSISRATASSCVIGLKPSYRSGNRRRPYFKT